MGMWVFEHRGIDYTPEGSNRFLFTPAEFVLINANNREEAMAYVRKYGIIEPYSYEWEWPSEDRTCRLYEDSNAIRNRAKSTSQYLDDSRVKRAGTIFMVEHYAHADVRNTYDFDGDEFKLMDSLRLEDWCRAELITPTFVSKPRPDLKDWGLF